MRVPTIYGPPGLFRRFLFLPKENEKTPSIISLYKQRTYDDLPPENSS
jgi:hypothetical protein